MEISKEDLKNLNYFWNDKQKKVRKTITPFLAAYIDHGDYEGTYSDISANLISLAMLSLEHKGLVERIKGEKNSEAWSLTADGEVLLRSKHPRLKIKIEELIESTPTITLIISGIIGFAASVAGLIQFYDWIFNPK